MACGCQKDLWSAPRYVHESFASMKPKDLDVCVGLPLESTYRKLLLTHIYRHTQTSDSENIPTPTPVDCTQEFLAG